MGPYLLATTLRYQLHTNTYTSKGQWSPGKVRAYRPPIPHPQHRIDGVLPIPNLMHKVVSATMITVVLLARVLNNNLQGAAQQLKTDSPEDIHSESNNGTS